MNRPVLVVLAFLGVFLAGAVSGGLVGVRMSENIARRRANEQFVQQQVFKRLADQIGLSQEQRTRIRPIVTKAGKDVQVHRLKILEILEKMDGELRQELTEEQRAQFEKLRARTRDNERLWQRWFREQRARRQEALGNSPPDTPPATP